MKRTVTQMVTYTFQSENEDKLQAVCKGILESKEETEAEMQTVQKRMNAAYAYNDLPIKCISIDVNVMLGEEKID